MHLNITPLDNRQKEKIGNLFFTLTHLTYAGLVIGGFLEITRVQMLHDLTSIYLCIATGIVMSVVFAYAGQKFSKLR